MARLSEQLRDWLARAEILARGVEHHRFDAARALEDGAPWIARSEALELLELVPGSPVALALWADAAEAMFLDHEAVTALERLAAAIPFRGDVWLRLGRARERLGRDALDAFERAAGSTGPSDAVDAAHIEMAERDLERGDPHRAQRWLERLGLAGRTESRARWLRLETALALDDDRGASEAVTGLTEPAALDARAWLTQARWRARQGMPTALGAWVRALILDAPGGLRAAADWVARGAPDGAVDELARLVEGLGGASEPSWIAALAFRRGRPAEALAALAATARDSVDGARLLLSAALRVRDPAALTTSLQALQAHGVAADPDVDALARALRATNTPSKLEALDGAAGPVADWADALRSEIYASWLGAHPDWPALLGEIAALARRFGSLEGLRDAESVAVDLERPLRIAVVGEFNAGKSSFINALLGEVVAPVGVLPTTATQNRVVWSPDRFVRVETVAGSGASDRVVAHAELARTLRELPAESIARVTIYAPLELLRRLELYDTPGFNAAVAGHAEIARTTVDETHVALWLLDATQPLKDSERAVLSEIAGRVPLVVLMNKRDRLTAPEAVEAALAYVRDGLAGLGIQPIAPVIALSARAALAARTSGNDPDALAASGWPAVERLIDEVLFARSDALRQRVLLERARRAVEGLAGLARLRDAARREGEAEVERIRAALRGAEGRMASDRQDLERRLEGVLDQRLERVRADVRPALGLADDAAARRFVVARARDALGGAAAEAILEWLRLDAHSAAARAVKDELERRVGTVSAALAPQLLSADDVSRSREQWVGVVADEAQDILRRAASSTTERVADPGERRSIALARAFGASIR